ncbi:MAG: hypothetical protein FVQ80_03195 [Planctomycetes bacterium]|nr:hypothetical protein [Planctomycetota bacterium]
MNGKYLNLVLILTVLVCVANKGYGWFGDPAASASMTSSSISANIGESVTFDSSASFSTEGSIEQYRWDFEGDGIFDYNETNINFADGAFDGITTHEYDTNGVYTVKVKVLDSTGNTDTDVVTIEITDNTSASNNKTILKDNEVELAMSGNEKLESLLNKSICNRELYSLESVVLAENNSRASLVLAAIYFEDIFSSAILAPVLQF